MTQRRARHLMMELARQIHLQGNGNLKGFGKIAKFYRADWRPTFHRLGIDSYDDAWNNDTIKRIRETVNM